MNLAIAEKQLGLPISDEAIEQMRAHLVSLNLLERGLQVLKFSRISLLKNSKLQL